MEVLSKEEFKKKKQAERDFVFGLLEEETQKVIKSPDELNLFFELLATHAASSVSNVLLLQAQAGFSIPMENTEIVLSIDEWEKRNVPVKKDANGYYPKGVFQIADDGEYLGADNRPHNKYKIYKGYLTEQTIAPDVAHTVAAFSPPIRIMANGADPQAAVNMALFSSSPVKCLRYEPEALIDEKENISEAEGVWYIPLTKTVIVRSIKANQWFLRLAIEIAFGLYHKEDGNSFSRERRAFEAGVVSFLLCRQSGITATFQFPDLPDSLKTPAVFRKRMEKCVELAHELSYRLEKKLASMEGPVLSTERGLT